MDLRDALPADAPALSRLGIDSFVAKFGHLYRPEDLSPFLDRVYGLDSIGADIADPLCALHLAEIDGALVGYCKMGLTCSWPDHARGSHAIELKQLYTAPGRTGQGIGAALMDWALDTARAHGADEVQLSVWSENHGAQRFYARYGFEKVADIEFWVGNHRDDEFLFAKRM